MDIKRILRGPIVWIGVAILVALLAGQFISSASAPKKVDTSAIIASITKGDAKSATIVDREQRIEIVLKNGDKKQSQYVTGQGVELQQLLQTKVDGGQLSGGYNIKVPKDNVLISLLATLLPIAIIVFLLFFFMNQVQGGGSKVMNFGKSKAKMMSKDTPQTTFADVAGADEAIEELEEIRDFLTDPARYQAVGAKIPKGVLLYGPPGTGKTLLARAVAGGAGLGGGHDEREQTLNQMLVEMDGFDDKGTVILIAATNRPDILDPALLRPGRFDRQIAVDRPDLQGRADILTVHAKGKPIEPEVDMLGVARRTPGFTGADLANVLNEAALLTARHHLTMVNKESMDEAIDRVIAGPQKHSRVMSDHEKSITAYHEGGHALVAAALQNTDPVHKVTILPRGRALGYTMVLPDQEKYSTTRNEMLDQLAYMLGGRAAEELVFHDPTTGASNDIEKATSVARAMVTQYGMTERLGAIKFGQESGEVFLGRDMGHQRDYSEAVAGVIDEEVRHLINQAHTEAYEILVDNRDVLDRLVLELLEKETLDKEQVAEIFTDIRKRSERPKWTGSTERIPAAGPISVPAKVNGSGSVQVAHNDVTSHDKQKD